MKTFAVALLASIAIASTTLAAPVAAPEHTPAPPHPISEGHPQGHLSRHPSHNPSQPEHENRVARQPFEPRDAEADAQFGQSSMMLGTKGMGMGMGGGFRQSGGFGQSFYRRDNDFDSEEATMDGQEAAMGGQGDEGDFIAASTPEHADNAPHHSSERNAAAFEEEHRAPSAVSHNSPESHRLQARNAQFGQSAMMGGMGTKGAMMGGMMGGGFRQMGGMGQSSYIRRDLNAESETPRRHSHRAPRPVRPENDETESFVRPNRIQEDEELVSPDRSPRHHSRDADAEPQFGQSTMMGQSMMGGMGTKGGMMGMKSSFGQSGMFKRDFRPTYRNRLVARHARRNIRN